MDMTDWASLHALGNKPLNRLFADDPTRVDQLSVLIDGLRFDFSKTHLTGELVSKLSYIARAQGLAAKRDALFAGAPINVTENRAAEH
ncbi:MAG: glucose-6-phosphate isomerase, partial [Sphingorhabdus sp.]